MAGEGDVERLVVMLEARIRDFEKNMAKASGTAGKSYGQMRKDSRKATDQMEGDMVRSTGRINKALAFSATKIGTFGKTLIGGLVAGGVAGIVSQVGQIASGIAQIGDEAKRAGIGVEAFQELAYVAKQNRIEVDSLTDGIKELNLRADEFIFTGKGSGAEAFQRLGYSAEELKEKLKDPAALFTEIIGKLGQLDKAAQIRIADEIFGGTGGEKFVQLIEQGEEGLKRTIKEARNLGLVMDQDMIDKAAEVDRKFNTLAEVVGTQLKGAVVDAASALLDFLNLFDTMERKSTANLEALYQKHVEVRKLFGNGAGPSEEEQALKGELTGRAYDQLRIGLAGLPSNRTLPSSGKPPSGGGRDKAAEEAERQAKAVQNLIAGLEFENQLIGMSEVEQAKMNALRQAGAAATDEQKAKIAELVEQGFAERDQVAQLQEAYAVLGQIGQTAITGIVDALKDSKIEGQELAAIMSDILGMAAQYALQAGSKAAFGSLGIGLATGGPVRGPGTGTSDSIPARLSNGEYVINARAAAQNRTLLDAINLGQVPRFADGGPVGSSPAPKATAGNVTNIFNIDAKGAELGVEQKIVQAIKNIVPGMIRDGAPVAVAAAQRNRRF